MCWRESGIYKELCKKKSEEKEEWESGYTRKCRWEEIGTEWFELMINELLSQIRIILMERLLKLKYILQENER